MTLYQTHTGKSWYITNQPPFEDEDFYTEVVFSGKLNELMWWLQCASRQALCNNKAMEITLKFGNNMYSF